MGDIGRKASLVAQHKDQPKWLKRSFILALLVLGLTLIMLGLRSAPRATYAQGVVQIASQGEELDIVISQASSDDPPGKNDPGKGLDVAECRLNLKQGKLVKLTIYNGYPGYTCTLQVTVHNRGAQAVRLQEAQVSASPGLEVRGANKPGTVIIPAGKMSQEAFQIRILKQAAELAQLEFQIVEVYTQAEASLSTR